MCIHEAFEMEGNGRSHLTHKSKSNILVISKNHKTFEENKYLKVNQKSKNKSDFVDNCAVSLYLLNCMEIKELSN